MTDYDPFLDEVPDDQRQPGVPAAFYNLVQQRQAASYHADHPTTEQLRFSAFAEWRDTNLSKVWQAALDRRLSEVGASWSSGEASVYEQLRAVDPYWTMAFATFTQAVDRAIPELERVVEPPRLSDQRRGYAGELACGALVYLDELTTEHQDALHEKGITIGNIFPHKCWRGDDFDGEWLPTGLLAVWLWQPATSAVSRDDAQQIAARWNCG